MTPVVAVAIPCRTDEPALARTLRAVHASWRRAALASTHASAVLIGLNGIEAAAAPALSDARVFAEEVGAPFVVVDVDAGGAVPELSSAAPLSVTVLATRRAGKAIAWNILRSAARGDMGVVVDADVAVSPDALGLLLDELARHPEAVLVSPKTTCAPRPTAFERVMAVPYAIDFPNLSGQLYAARWRDLPPAMPEDLIEPERWLELVVGRARVRRVPQAQVVVRLPGPWADFWRQRIRIEMGKVQLRRAYAGLASRGAPQPRALAALQTLSASDLVRLAIYLGLRTLAYAIAWWRYRRGATAGVWRQAASTKQWDAGA